jgi:enterochelin esterase family protein
VSVQSDLLYADEDSNRYTDHTRRIKMRLQSDGCFHVTTRAVSPETYTYCFRVNGKRKPDPLNPDTAWQKMHKWNVVNVGGSKHADLYRAPLQQGELIHATWYSTNEKLRRRVNIYLPAAFNRQNSDFPVLYLIHGINGYEGSWSERGRAIHILENMVAEGLCKPMILVMPDVNVGVHEDRPSHHTLWNNIFNYPRLCHDHDIEKGLVELIQMVDSASPVSGKHYIAGLSDGARIAANTANLLPGYFEAIGMFSPVVHKSQLPADSAMVFVYTGKGDMFHLNAKRFNKHLDKNKTAHCYQETTGGHTWRNWRLYLSDFLKRVSFTSPDEL